MAPEERASAPVRVVPCGELVVLEVAGVAVVSFPARERADADAVAGALASGLAAAGREACDEAVRAPPP